MSDRTTIACVTESVAITRAECEDVAGFTSRAQVVADNFATAVQGKFPGTRPTVLVTFSADKSNAVIKCEVWV